eukprot:TRINITY_DN12569_c0_g2_i2.p1 TRINITY_DN12569_c0_g2~~TRINITY_DN12569_c0_g2_i2.p1  ORF type:complete len:290 (+),score=26.27 TRINITY_DN12569_c0_g2_i2:492-1361(+)
MWRLFKKTGPDVSTWFPAPPGKPRPPASPQKRTWHYDSAAPELSFAPGFGKHQVLRHMAQLFTMRSRVTSRKDYDQLPALAFEDEDFLWSGRSFHAVAREFLIIDEYMGKTFVVQDRVMATMPKKKQWQMAYIFGVFCTKPVADAVERKLEEVKSETVYQKIAELIMDSVSHPAEMFPVHSIFSATIHRKLVQQTVADAKATMRDNGFYVPTRMPRLRLRDAGNHTRSKLNVMTQLRSMKMRSTKTFGKKTCGGFSPVSATNTKMVGRFGRSVRISMITCSLVQVRGGV